MVTVRTAKTKKRKVFINSKIPIICKVCGSKENIVRANKIIQMSVHHVDGNHNNNELSNLVWICERCHQYLHNPNGIHSELIKLGTREKESR